jgi:hypothetical protein
MLQGHHLADAALSLVARCLEQEYRGFGKSHVLSDYWARRQMQVRVFSRQATNGCAHVASADAPQRQTFEALFLESCGVFWVRFVGRAKRIDVSVGRSFS